MLSRYWDLPLRHTVGGPLLVWTNCSNRNFDKDLGHGIGDQVTRCIGPRGWPACGAAEREPETWESGVRIRIAQPQCASPMLCTARGAQDIYCNAI